jgi:hypothetical protein
MKGDGMTCPPDIATVVSDILQKGLLRIRAAGWAADAARCAIEADHVHNLPMLLRSYSPDRLRYYWEVERPTFIEQSGDVDLGEFQELWDELGDHIEAAAESFPQK